MNELNEFTEIKDFKALRLTYEENKRDALLSLKNQIKELFISEKQEVVIRILEYVTNAFDEFMTLLDKLFFYGNNFNNKHHRCMELLNMTIQLFDSFIEWFKENVCTLPDQRVIDGTIIQMINQFVNSPCQELYIKVNSVLTESKDEMSDNTRSIIQELLSKVQFVNMLDKDQLMSHIISLGDYESSSKNSIETLTNLLVECMTITNAESGTIYILNDKKLEFLLLFNNALQMQKMNPELLAKKFPPIDLYDKKTNHPNTQFISVYTVLNNKITNISNIDEFREIQKNKSDNNDDDDDKMMGAEVFEEKTGYHGITFLSAPIMDKSGKIIGVLQVSNRLDQQTGEIVRFPEEFEAHILKLAKLASKPLEKLVFGIPFWKKIGQKIQNLFKVKDIGFPIYKQPDQMDCGPTCLKMISKYFEKDFSLQLLREKCYITNQGVSLYSLSEAAEKIGFNTLAYSINFSDLLKMNLPCILCWGAEHYIIIYKTTKKHIYIADPGFGLIKYSHDQFIREWKLKNNTESIPSLTLSPTPYFYHPEEEFQEKDKSIGFSFFFKYLMPFKKYIVQLFIGLSMMTLLGLVPPFLTQTLVDYGIQNKNISFVYVLLVAQIMLFVGQTAISFISRWIILFIGSKINIAMLSDFFAKLMRLSITFFEVKTRGDILQRVRDHARIKSLLSNASVMGFFNVFSIFLFAIILYYYSTSIFFIFFIGSAVSALWITLFLKKIKLLDFKMFDQESKSQSMMIEMLNGINEIKLNSIEKETRWKWEKLKILEFKINIDGLKLKQMQKLGYLVINQFKNILITFLSAKLVIDGHITLGIMMSMQYIIGQLNGPINQLISLISTVQLSSIAVERLSAVHTSDNEEKHSSGVIRQLPKLTSFNLKTVSFHYEGPDSDPVLNQLSLTIPHGKTTAIVGASGSGKTTLLKLLLKFYVPTKGIIEFGGEDLSTVPHSLFRAKCGVVLQDGYMFADTIRKNIVLSDDVLDENRYKNAVDIACVDEFVSDFHQGYDTKVGVGGMGLSKGQKQRVFIARAIYKNPEIMFFDEATSALDASTEKKLTDNLNNFYKGKTIFIIAHRLSTVKDADQIAVLVKGQIIELGTHQTLVQKKGFYFNLVKDQLNLGD